MQGFPCFCARTISGVGISPDTEHPHEQALVVSAPRGRRLAAPRSRRMRVFLAGQRVARRSVARAKSNRDENCSAELLRWRLRTSRLRTTTAAVGGGRVGASAVVPIGVWPRRYAARVRVAWTITHDGSANSRASEAGRGPARSREVVERELLPCRSTSARGGAAEPPRSE